MVHDYEYMVVQLYHISIYYWLYIGLDDYVLFQVVCFVYDSKVSWVWLYVSSVTLFLFCFYTSDFMTAV